jgi:hypothetical protein
MAAVRPHGVVFLEPSCQHDAGFEHAVKAFAVQFLVAHGAVESLDVGVLLRASPLDEGLADLLLGEPVRQPSRRKLAAVVGAQQPRLAVAGKQPLQFHDHISCGEAPRDATAERDPRVLVDDVQDPKRPTVVGAGRHEVVRPDVVRPRRRKLPDRPASC